MTSESADGANAPLLGHVVAERYFVEKHLGEGGMGTVYRARHITLDKLVALKVLHGEFSRKEDLVERFLQEAKAASRIRNAHVIDITDFGLTSEGYVFFAMEYLEGKDLHGLLKEQSDQGNLIPWIRARDIFLQVCEALGAAHAEGIIHRDLKPENVFLVDGTGRTDYVKLLDFGIAKVESTGGEGEDSERKLTKTGMLFGTPEYMAPEQARGEKPDNRVDVYAMGCMLFQFLTGTVPFKADSFMAILTQHMVEPVPAIGPELLARSGAPIEILEVVCRALEKNRDKRYSSMAELAAAVRAASEGLSTLGPLPKGNTSSARAQRPTASGGDWTGSVRFIDELEEDDEEEEEEQFAAAAEPEELVRTNARRPWLVPMAAITVLGGAGIAVALAMSGGDSAKHTEPQIEAVKPPGASETTQAIAAEAKGTPNTLTPSAPQETEPTTNAEAVTKPAAGSVEKPTETVSAAAKLPADRGKPTSKGEASGGEATTPGDGANAAGSDKTPGDQSPDKAPKEKTPGDESPGEPALKSPFDSSASPAPPPSPAP